MGIVSTAVLCPLEVISTRLSIQKNHATSGFSASAEEEDPMVQGLDFAAADEDVIAYVFIIPSALHPLQYSCSV